MREPASLYKEEEKPGMTHAGRNQHFEDTANRKKVESLEVLCLAPANDQQLQLTHKRTVRMSESELHNVMAKIGEVEAEIAETKNEIKKAKDDGRTEAYLISLQNSFTSLQNNLAELRHKENLLMTTGSGNVIIA